MSTQQVITVAGCPLHWSRRGEGTPILFVQGVGVHGDGWLPQIDDLARDHACVWFDNRGIGRSLPRGDRLTVPRMADDALAVLDAAGIDRAHVVGHSLGGMVAQQLALRAPERVLSLALLCTFANGRTVARGSRMFWLGLRSRLGTRRMRQRAFLEMVLPPQPLPSAGVDALAARYAPLFGHDLATQPRHALEQLLAFRRCDLLPQLPALAAVPTLVVAAAHDVVTEPPHGRAIAQAIPGARYVELADVAHGLPITHPQRANRVLRDHLAPTDRGQDGR